jgi:cytochrome c peroxidase
MLTEERAHLGKRLFFDPRLSRTGLISCSSCHDQAHAFSDPRPVSLGVDGRAGTRNAPALVNLAWGTSFFWDGRARTLEDQAGQPIANPVEMDSTLDDAVQRVTAEASYVDAFRSAYGAATDTGTTAGSDAAAGVTTAGSVTEAALRRALASFIRTLVSGDSPYDRFLAGDASALDAAEQRGEELFFSERTGCFHCHPRGTLTNAGFFNDGSYAPGGDTGRQMITGRTGDLGKFKVPGLRNVAASAPYMHDGSLATLADVLAQYDRGGRGHPSTDPQIAPLGLTDEEQADLLAFLEALTDAKFLEDPRFHP